MELTVHLNSLAYINDFQDMGVKCFIVGTKYFSCRAALELDYSELAILKCNIQGKLFVLVNALVDEKYLNELKIHLNKLVEIGVDGIIFQDWGVFQLVNDLAVKWELIYNPDTLNTNGATLNYLATLGIDGAFLAREISLAKKQEIAQACKMKTMIQVHGVEYMSYSKRQLLATYKTETKLDFPVDKEADIRIKAQNNDDLAHIYQDKFGTHIFSGKQLMSLDKLSGFTVFDYLYIESLFIDPVTLVEIVNAYQEAIDAINHGTYGRDYKSLTNRLKQLCPNVVFHHSFLFDQTLYKIEDVRKRDNHENK